MDCKTDMITVKLNIIGDNDPNSPTSDEKQWASIMNMAQQPQQ